jgi:hypothetical protein
MAVTGAAIVANQKAGGKPARRVGAYIKAHWKELLALVLAAIPALFILFSVGARKQAHSIATLSPTGAAGSSAPSTSDPAAAVAAVAAPVTAAVAAVKSVVTGSTPASSTNGYNPTKAATPTTNRTTTSTLPPAGRLNKRVPAPQSYPRLGTPPTPPKPVTSTSSRPVVRSKPVPI